MQTVSTIATSPPNKAAQINDDKRLGNNLDRLIEAGRNGVFSEIMSITPAMARVLLARNVENRPLSKIAVDKYRREIVQGQWAVNGQTIVISRDGKLNDGQHRLHAIIAAGKSVSVIVVFGVERETRFTLDQNVARTAGHFIGMHGVENANMVAALAGYIWQHKTHGFLSASALYRPSRAEVLRTARHFEHISDVVKAIPTKGSLVVGGRSLLAFCYFSISAVADEAAASVFIARLMDGVGLSARSPILYARNRLIGMPSGRISPNEKAELIFRSWNAHRRGDFPKTMPILGGKLPTLER